MRHITNGFARAKHMFAVIAAIMAATPNIAEREEHLRVLGPYRSRGKGRAGHQASRHTIAQDKRAALKARNRKAHRRHA